MFIAEVKLDLFLVLFCLKCSNFLYAGDKSKHYMLIQYYTIEHVNCNELNGIIANAEDRLAKEEFIPAEEPEVVEEVAEPVEEAAPATEEEPLLMV